MLGIVKAAVVSLIAASIFTVPSFLAAETNGFTIEGSATCPKTGDLYIKLMNQEQFERDIEGKDAGTQFALRLKTDANDNKREASFKFVNVPKGTYVISFYQDVNGNGKCDVGMLGPKEPWGMYKVRPVFKPVFKKVCFELSGNLTNLKLEAK